MCSKNTKFQLQSSNTNVFLKQEEMFLHTCEVFDKALQNIKIKLVSKILLHLSSILKVKMYA